jgi:Ca2+-transporting ATPase
LVGLLDPPRNEVKAAINRCQAAGIRVLMVTGDQPTTGRAIGRAVGIGDDEDAPAMHGKDLLPIDEMTDEYKQRVLKTVVFARVSPEQKLNLVDFYQQRGEPVAMTGDGVNDAPALKKADIGIAMGQRGTDAAKQTADMILQDDSFETIVKAVEQGRIIFGNIRKAVVFMLCTNVAEILAVTIASIAGLPLPLRPLQILYLNVVTDVFPALALGVGRGRPAVMDSPPRDKDEPVLTRHHWTAIIAWSIVIAVCVMAALMIAGYIIGYDVPSAVTVSFLTLALGKLWFVFNLRDHDAPRLDNDIVRNGWLWGAIGLCLVLLAAAVYLPILSTVLQTVPPSGTGWIVILALSILPALIGLFVPGIHFQSGSGIKPMQNVDSESGLAKELPD